MTAKETLLMEGVKDPNFGMLTGTMPVILSAMEKFAKSECENKFSAEQVRKLLWDARLFYTDHQRLPYNRLRPIFKDWVNEILKNKTEKT